MRYLTLILIFLGLWPGVVRAEMTVDELVGTAVQALATTSYEARMRFMAPYAKGEEQVVHIYHVAPQLYHVRPLVQDSHGTWDEGTIYYVENAVDLTRVYERKGQVAAVEPLPERAFFINDALTTKFLHDLAAHEGTVVLNGQVGQIPVFILRQTTQPAKPYTITVGLDKHNYFPLFLLVTDSIGDAEVYYEMEAVEYRQAVEIDAELFRIPENASQANLQQLRSNQISPDLIEVEPGKAGGQSKLSVKRAPSAVPAEESMNSAVLQYDLPLYPTWLPKDYQLESIRLLDYRANSGDADSVTLVYQLELFGPGEGEAISIFQTSAGDLDLSTDAMSYRVDSGYVIEKRGNWLVAVIGDPSVETLMQIIEGLTARDDKVQELLELTKARDTIRQQAINFSD